ncbi:MAG: hypothetical protein GY809_29825, partial [Planctomycetes bacterium]|nr:hypothetical protein [Planctomycetota bacterium]
MRRSILVSLVLAAVVLICGYQALACETNDPPYAYIDPWGPTYVLEGDSIRFEDDSDDYDGYIDDYDWYCYSSYATPYWGSSDTYEPTFKNGPKRVVVDLWVTDDDGAYDYDYSVVYILDSFDATCSDDEVVLNGDVVEVDLPVIDSSWSGYLRFDFTGGSEHVQVFTDAACTDRVYDNDYWRLYRFVPDTLYVKGTSLSNTDEIRFRVGVGPYSNQSQIYSDEIRLTCVPEPVNVSASIPNNGYIGQGSSSTLTVNLSPAVSSGTVSLSIAESSGNVTPNTYSKTLSSSTSSTSFSIYGNSACSFDNSIAITAKYTPAGSSTPTDTAVVPMTVVGVDLDASQQNPRVNELVDLTLDISPDAAATPGSVALVPTNAANLLFFKSDGTTPQSPMSWSPDSVPSTVKVKAIDAVSTSIHLGWSYGSGSAAAQDNDQISFTVASPQVDMSSSETSILTGTLAQINLDTSNIAGGYLTLSQWNYEPAHIMLYENSNRTGSLGASKEWALPSTPSPIQIYAEFLTNTSLN